MRVLVVGKGGREHAIVHALSQSSQAPEIWVLPGNPGMAELAQCLNVSQTFENTLQQCQELQIDLVIIGPEDPLVEGWASKLRQAGFNVFGPDQKGAELEGSKITAKKFMQKYSIPTSRFIEVSSLEEITFHISNFTAPYVFKADGLAAGKGVYICDTLDELKGSADQVFHQKKLGAAGERALLEQFMPGYELSYFVLTNGKDWVSLPLAQDHKKLSNGDFGPNTGGMGTVAPLKISSTLQEQIDRTIVEPTVRGLSAEGMDYRGVIFIGLMITEEGPQVLEYNVRFGDPETQVLLPLLKGDWLDVFAQVSQGAIPQLTWHQDRATACVVMAARNYPHTPVLNSPICGELKDTDDQYFLHAGTALNGDQLVTAGGRVLNAVGVGQNLSAALEKAYSQAKQASWAGQQMRTDIGQGALKNLVEP